MNPEFIHLNVHSAYSLAEGAIKIPKLLALAKENKMPALAITDTGNLFGSLEFALEASYQGIQPIIGCKLKIKSEEKTGLIASKAYYDSLLILVQNETGYKNLLKLVSKSFLESPTDTPPHILFEDLEKYNQGLIVLSGGTEGIIGRLLIKADYPAALENVQAFKALLGDRFYLEVMRHGMKEEILTEEALLKLAFEENIPIVATNAVFFSDPSMYEAHDILLCIAEGSYAGETNRRKLTPHHYFKSAHEMKRLFKDLPEAVENTVKIAQRCAFMPKESKPFLPPFASNTGRNEAEELRYQAALGLKMRLETQVFKESMSEEEKKQLITTYEERLEYELKVIIQMGFPGYFLIVSDFIKWAKSQRIPVGPGRGSGAGSLVAWSLTITDINPIQFNLLFERFLNPERVSMPDFDVDFCQDRRDEVISYVQEKYGKDKVAQIITFGKLQARAVLRDVGRVLQMPYGQVDKISKMIPHNPSNPLTLQDALNQDSELREMRSADASVGKLIDIALKLEGLYRHASTHAAGVIIGDRPLEELVPLYRDPRSNMPVTQFNMKFVEKAGLVKFDFLGLKTLTVLECAASMVRQKGENLEVSNIPIDDQTTFELLQRVETTGVFQLESAGMRDVVRKLKPDRFEEIIALVALYRPGPMDDIPRYLACKHGEEEVKYLDPSLEPLLQETFGVMVYQEQVMQIAQVLGGYTLGKADLLRRAMGKKIKEEMDAQRRSFLEGAVQNGIPDSLANQIFDQMAKFAGYGFNKSHSAPYALIAYQTAFMKANYPVEFMAATMTYDMGNTDKLNMYRQEIKEMGISLLPPDINMSYVKFSVENQAVRYALAALKNVGANAMEELIAERESKGKFQNIQDFVERLSGKVLNRRQLESLICAGAFDSLEPNRHQLLASLDNLLKYADCVHAEKKNAQVSLFAQEPTQKMKFQDVKVSDWDHIERLEKERDAIGFYLSSHPLDGYDMHLKNMGTVKSSQIGENREKTIKIAGIITGLKEHITKTAKKIAFISLSDEQGSFEATVFSEVFIQARSYLSVGNLVLATLKVQADGEEGFRLMGLSFRPLEEAFDEKERIFLVYIQEESSLSEVAALLNKAEGGRQKAHLVLGPQEGMRALLRLPGSYTLGSGLVEKIKKIPGVQGIEERQIH
jgi:DNA polymerase-3 subunit alpha